MAFRGVIIRGWLSLQGRLDREGLSVLFEIKGGGGERKGRKGV